MRTRLRVQAADVLYHVTSRGVDRQRIFGVVDGDRAVFHALLARTVDRYGWNLHAYCLMGNHFHLVFDTPGANIAAGMQHLKSTYALWFNGGRPREGCLFERRYFSRVVEDEWGAAEVCRYVVLNPVRARLCRHPADWAWSSYRASAGIIDVPPFLRCDLLHELVGGSRKYAAFVAAGLALPGV